MMMIWIKILIKIILWKHCPFIYQYLYVNMLSFGQKNGGELAKSKSDKQKKKKMKQRLSGWGIDDVKAVLKKFPSIRHFEIKNHI